MGNKYPQTNEAKAEFKSPLLNYMVAVEMIEPDHIFTRDELSRVFETSDRAIRKEMEHLANFYPVISTSNKKGYKIGRFNDTDSLETLNELLNKTDHTLNELQCRVESLQARMKPLIALKEKLKEKILDVEFDQEDLNQLFDIDD